MSSCRILNRKLSSLIECLVEVIMLICDCKMCLWEVVITYWFICDEIKWLLFDNILLLVSVTILSHIWPQKYFVSLKTSYKIPLSFCQPLEIGILGSINWPVEMGIWHKIILFLTRNLFILSQYVFYFISWL